MPWQMRNVNRGAFPPTSESVSTLQFQQSVEKGTITLQGNPQVLSGDVVTAIPLLFQAGPFVGETFRESLHHRSYQLVCAFERPARLVDEASLYLARLCSEISHLRFRKQGHRLRNCNPSIQSLRLLAFHRLGSFRLLLRIASLETIEPRECEDEYRQCQPGEPVAPQEIDSGVVHHWYVRYQ